MLFSTTQLAQMEGVTTQTIRRWIRAGHYEDVQQTKGGHFRVKVKQERVICYARVSSKKQSSSIETQRDILLRKHANAEFVFDVASSFNFRRKGLRSILERSFRGDPIKVVVASQDRLSRAGFDLIKWFIELSGGCVEVLDDNTQAKSVFDSETLISFITSFCNSYYGRRSHQRRKGRRDKEDPLLS
ncbi:recombinase family protein [Vibrio breoganii]